MLPGAFRKARPVKVRGADCAQPCNREKTPRGTPWYLACSHLRTRNTTKVVKEEP